MSAKYALLSLLGRGLREPLLQFLLLGSGLFVLYSLGDGAPSATPDRIVVDEAQVGRLAEQFQRTWMRPPTPGELEGLAEDFVKEEVLYREAVALGLDRDELVIRRRMRQKMEFLNADLAEQRKPTEAELQAYLDEYPDKFRRPERVSFQQIFVSPEGAEKDPRAFAADLLARLRAEPGLASDPGSLGDPTLLPPGMERASAREVAAVFGSALAEAVAQADPGGWSGPYPSSYGLHLLFVTDREPGGVPSLDEVRPAAEREWLHDRRQDANERFYEALRGRYRVEIRLPDAADGDGQAGQGR